MGTAANALAKVPVVYRDSDMTLYRVGGDMAGASVGKRRLMVLAHLVWVAVLVGGAAGTAVATLRRARLRPDR